VSEELERIKCTCTNTEAPLLAERFAAIILAAFERI